MDVSSVGVALNVDLYISKVELIIPPSRMVKRMKVGEKNESDMSLWTAGTVFHK